jgi:hypothetical protein
VSFLDAKNIEPKDLITFDDAYLNHLIELKKYLQANIGCGSTPLLIKRINQDTEIIHKEVKGLIQSVSDDRFIFLVHEDLSSTYDFEHPWTIRLDSVLGDIPLLPDAGNIKLAKISESFKPYLKSLAEMRALLLTAVGKKHAATIHFRFKNDMKTYCLGDYHVDCEILEVNKSNAKIKRLKASAYINKDDMYCDFAVVEKHVRFVSDCYVWKVSLNLNEDHVVNRFDDY